MSLFRQALLVAATAVIVTVITPAYRKPSLPVPEIIGTVAPAARGLRKPVRRSDEMKTKEQMKSSNQVQAATSGSGDHQTIEQLKILEPNNQIRELQTVIRDRKTSRGDFVFCADRLIRLVVEEGLNLLPYKTRVVTTPTDYEYEGVDFVHGNCGVSIMRSGEAMEHGLRDCCRSIRIGKILIKTIEDTGEARRLYAKFPPDISRRKVLLMYPILSTGSTVIQAVNVLKEHVQERNIFLLTLFCTPFGVETVTNRFPEMKVLTSEVDPVIPTHFGQKYFGTD